MIADPNPTLDWNGNVECLTAISDCQLQVVRF